MNKPQNNTGITRLVNAMRFSYQGFVQTLKTEEAFRQECLLFLVLFIASFFVAQTAIQWLLLVVSLLLVLLTELLNSAIEAAIDRFGKEHHVLSGKAKDAGSAAVSIALLIVIVTWGAILFS